LSEQSNRIIGTYRRYAPKIFQRLRPVFRFEVVDGTPLARHQGFGRERKRTAAIGDRRVEFLAVVRNAADSCLRNSATGRSQARRVQCGRAAKLSRKRAVLRRAFASRSKRGYRIGSWSSYWRRNSRTSQ